LGKLILCSGTRTTKPYLFASTGVRIYSIEELCYYIYSHVYYIDEDIFSEDLFDWIGNELKLVNRAEKLKKMREENENIKSMVTVVLCSADYYTEAEIMKLLHMIDEIAGMTPMKRNCFKAGNYLKDSNFVEAVIEYEKVLDSKEAKGLTPQEYGDILHNLGVAKAHVTGLQEAVGLFREAFERNQNEESLRQYLCALKLTKNDALFMEEVATYQVNQALYDSIINTLDILNVEAKESSMMQDIVQMKEWKSIGKVNEYYKRVDEMICSWKKQYRRETV